MRVKIWFDNKVKYVNLEKETISELMAYATKIVAHEEPNVSKPNFSGAIEVINVNGASLTTNIQVQNLLRDQYVFIRLYDVFCPSGDIPVAYWYWQDEHQRWNAYTAHDNTLLEEAYQTGKASVSIFNGTYSCNVNTRTQTRVSTKVVRKMMRATWFWEATASQDFSGYVPYPESVSVIIENQYQTFMHTGQPASVQTNDLTVS